MIQSYKGKYSLQHKEKYLGLSDPAFKSGLEQRMMYWLDNNVNVVKWGYENITVPYTYMVDNKNHTYYVDFYAEIKERDTENIKKYLIEVKPFCETLQPKSPKIKNRKAIQRYMTEMATYVKNQNKWQMASNYAHSLGMEFKVVTERNLTRN